MLVFSKTNKEADALTTQTIYTSDEPMEEQFAASGTTTEREIRVTTTTGDERENP